MRSGLILSTTSSRRPRRVYHVVVCVCVCVVALVQWSHQLDFDSCKLCYTLSTSAIAVWKGNVDTAGGEAAGGGGGGAWVGTSEYYMAVGGDGAGITSEASAAKAKIFFELWEEDKSMPVGGS